MENLENLGIPRAYDSSQVEDRIYQNWLDGGIFTPNIDPKKQPFTIIQPPPNVTGELHLGHAQRAAVEDAITRWHRMRGEPTLWLPGVDHAAIATQVVVERELSKEGLTRHDLGREKFLERVWQWMNSTRGRIGEQHRRLGVSCDWSREQFTLDPGPSRAVRHTFVNLYRKGLIYRGERIINWCPRCVTALSDLEVEHAETQGHLYLIRYPFTDGSGALTVATTRPETLLGDTAVAVSPTDERYKGMAGKTVVLPIIGRHIPVIVDESVDPAFGTGALKVTPGHDHTDFEIGTRHNLPIVTIIDLDGTLNAEAGPYQGVTSNNAREDIVRQLEAEGLLEQTEPYTHSVGHCQRCDQVVEPLVSQQWWMRMESLAQPALEAVKNGDIRILPERFNRVYENWMENIRDWCISRQLWLGHRIPVWYCINCLAQIVDYDDPSVCTECGSRDIEQDPDVLDTWFSSALWPHSTLGWPDSTEDLRYFYPTSVMETAYEILFFWVARMIMMGIENMGQAPFHTVYLSGLIRDADGAKMSKTRGNVVNPLDAIDKYGADALRFALTAGVAPGNDMRLRVEKLEAARNFANKIWNAARFVLNNLDGANQVDDWFHPIPQTLEDSWILSRLERLVARVQRNFEEYQLGEAEQSIYEFLWDDYCDWFIEASKIRLRSGASSPLPVLAHVLEKTLRLLHPFMPFITEELWQALMRLLPKPTDSPKFLATAPYPEGSSIGYGFEAETGFDLVRDLVRVVRNVRAEFRIEPQRLVEVQIQAGDLTDELQTQVDVIKALARAEPLSFLPDGKIQGTGHLQAVVRRTILSIPLGDLVDLEKERGRLNVELAEAETYINGLQGRLGDEKFLTRAPADVVERERSRLQEVLERRDRIHELLNQIGT